MPRDGVTTGRERVPAWLAGGVVLGAFAALAWLEHRRPLRRETEPRLVRTARNLAVAALGAVAVQVAEQPIVRPVAAFVARRRIGLLQRMELPRWLETVLAALLLDYTLFVWHILAHRVPLLWRFHQVHHADLDLDASTALRFHFGELAISVPWRIVQIVVLGVPPFALSVWQTGLLVSILFHHSNVRLPIEVERGVARIVVTPRLHGIHHSIVPEEAGSNWSSGLSIWDRLHGSLRGDVPQAEVTIGVPAYRDPREVALPRILRMPFGRQRASWVLPGDGVPARGRTSRRPGDLLA